MSSFCLVPEAHCQERKKSGGFFLSLSLTLTPLRRLQCSFRIFSATKPRRKSQQAVEVEGKATFSRGWCKGKDDYDEKNGFSSLLSTTTAK